MAPQLRTLGVGAKVTCLSKYVHPSHHIHEKYPNPVSRHCLEGCVVVHQELKKVSQHIRDKYPNPVCGHHLEVCVVVRQELKKVSRRDQLCIIVHHNNFKTADGTIVELHVVKSYWKVVEEGDSDFFFLMILLQRRRGSRNQFQLHCLMSSIKQSMDNPPKTTQSKHSMGW